MSSSGRENGRSGGYVRGEGGGFEVAALSWHVHLNGDPRGTERESAVNLPLTVAGGFYVVGDGRTSPLGSPGTTLSCDGQTVPGVTPTFCPSTRNAMAHLLVAVSSNV